MKSILTSTAIVALLTAPAMADGVNYNRFSYDATRLQLEEGSDSVDFNNGLLQGSLEYTVGQIVLSGDLARGVVSTDPETIETTTFEYAFGAGFLITPEILVGVGATGIDIELDDGSTTLDADANGAELFGQYRTSQFGAGINVSQVDLDEDNVTTTVFGEVSPVPEATLAGFLQDDSEFDGTTYYGTGSFDVAPFQANGFFLGNSDTDVTLFGFGGSYGFTPALSAQVDFASYAGDDAPDLYSVTFGGAYEFTEGFSADLNVGYVDGDDVAIDEVTVFTLALTYEFGDRQRLDNSIEQRLEDDIATGAASALTLGF